MHHQKINLKKQAGVHVLCALLLVCLVGAIPAYAAKGDKKGKKNDPTQVYSTNIHGATGLVLALVSIVDHRPEYQESLDDAISWLVDQLVAKHSNGKVTWRVTDVKKLGDAWTARKGGGKPQITPFDKLYLKYAEPRYLDFAEAGAMWRIQQGGSSSTPWGKGIILSSKRHRNTSAGASHGAPNTVLGLCEVYAIRPNSKIKSACESAIKHFRYEALVVDSGEETMMYWHYKGGAGSKKEDKNICETGRCYGQAGTLETLLLFHETFPKFRFSDGLSALDMANQNFRYMANLAIEDGNGYNWDYTRNLPNVRMKNPGYGSGVAGIGQAFLLGMDANQKAGNEEMVILCKKYALGAANQVMNMIQGSSPAGSGLCGGGMGAALFLHDMDRHYEKTDPALSKSLKSTGRKIGQLLDKKKMLFKTGIGWPAKGSFGGRNAVNFALDYGQTGQIIILVELYEWLGDKKYLDMAGKAVDFMLAASIKEETGIKIPWIFSVKGLK